MIYKIILSNTKETIQVTSDEELKSIIEFISRGDKIIVCKNGVFNPSYLVSIVEDRESYLGIFGHVKTLEEKQLKQLELNQQPSSFAKALTGNNFQITGSQQKVLE